jgi:hypothetical protein
VKVRCLFAFLLLLLVPTGVNANAFKQMSSEERVRKSDVVVVGIVEFRGDGLCMAHGTCAKLSIRTVLKGEPAAELWFQYGGTIAEESPRCCDIGQRAVFFLKRHADGFYIPVDGPASVRTIPLAEDTETTDQAPMPAMPGP